jgi:hypothetical protein
MNYRATLRACWDRYVADGLMFHMPGRWRIAFELDRGRRGARSEVGSNPRRGRAARTPPALAQRGGRGAGRDRCAPCDVVAAKRGCRLARPTAFSTGHGRHHRHATPAMHAAERARSSRSAAGPRRRLSADATLSRAAMRRRRPADAQALVSGASSFDRNAPRWNAVHGTARPQPVGNEANPPAVVANSPPAQPMLQAMMQWRP